MFKNAIVKLTCLLLSQDLTEKQRNLLASCVLKKLGALPLHDTFQFNDLGEVVVSGKVIDSEKALQIREYANSALDNKTLVLIREQVAYEAIVSGVHKNTGDSAQLFMRAALWWEQRSLEHLNSLAGRSSS